jgi:hypothetical protein
MSMRAPSVSIASTHLSVGRRELTVAVDSGASSRGTLATPHACPVHDQPEALQE